MCLGDWQLMRHVVGENRSLTLTGSYAEFLPPRSNRVGFWLPTTTAGDYFIWPGVQDAASGGRLDNAGTIEPFPYSFLNFGLIIRESWVGRSLTGADITMNIIEFTVPSWVMERILQGIMP